MRTPFVKHLAIFVLVSSFVTCLVLLGDSSVLLREFYHDKPDLSPQFGVYFDFIEIGTSDFNTLLQVAPDGSRGLSVDANAIYLDRLPNKNSVKKVNKALSDDVSLKFMPLYFLTPEDISNYNLSDWLRGCSQVGEPHAMLVAELKARNLEHLMQMTSIEVISFSKLLTDYNASGIMYLKIDAEINTLKIASSVINTCISFRHLCPRILSFEFWTGESASIHFKDKVEEYNKSIQQIVGELISLGYVRLETTGEDKYFVYLNNHM